MNPTAETLANAFEQAASALRERYKADKDNDGAQARTRSQLHHAMDQVDYYLGKYKDEEMGRRAV
jgi:hypothetical protein